MRYHLVLLAALSSMAALADALPSGAANGPAPFPGGDDLSARDVANNGTIAAGLDPLQPGDFWCETSWASPTEQEINWMIVDIMNYKDKTCRQTNSLGSKCKQIASHNGGQVSMCGSRYSAACYTVASAVDHIRQRCTHTEKNRAGGKYRYAGTNNWVMLH